MKIEVLKENLKSGLIISERIVGKNISLPILHNVLITTENNFLSLISTDLEVTIKLWMLVKIINKGSVVVPAKFLSSFITSLPNEKITMEQRDQSLYIECGNVKTKIQGHNLEDFPIIPEFKNTETLEVDSQALYGAISQVVDIASQNQGRPEISGVYFSFLKNSIKVVATDSFRLAEKNIHLSEPIKKEHSFILPQKSAREIMNILEGRGGAVIIYFSPNQVLFEVLMKEVGHPEVQVTSRLIDGEYPNYQDIIPSKFKTHITVSKDQFLNQIKTASLFSGKVNEVRISLSTEKQDLEISSKSQDVGEHTSLLKAKIEGEAIQISFNYKFLMDALLHMKSSEVILEISKEDGSCLLRPLGDYSYICVVMPIKSLQ